MDKKEIEIIYRHYLDDAFTWPEKGPVIHEPDSAFRTDAGENGPDCAPETENKHAGHRQKLRDRFIREKGFENFEDHQILELLLFYANPRSDTNPIAHELLERFDNLKNVLEARPERLMTVKGVGDKAATLISMVVPLTRAYERYAMQDQRRVGNCRDAEHYCKSLLMGEQNERFYVICLNAQCQIVGKRRISEGSLSEVSAYPRSVVETSLNHNAHSVLLCHNHPGGTCAPSREDIASTTQLQRILGALNILLLDHIIVAGTQTYSMIQHGDIDYRVRN